MRIDSAWSLHQIQSLGVHKQTQLIKLIFLGGEFFQMVVKVSRKCVIEMKWSSAHLLVHHGIENMVCRRNYDHIINELCFIKILSKLISKIQIECSTLESPWFVDRWSKRLLGLRSSDKTARLQTRCSQQNSSMPA